MVYMEMNMVRAGVVRHPSQWRWGGYREIQRPKRKCALVAYERLSELAGFETYDEFRSCHERWLEASLKDGHGRQSQWTQSVAVGSVEFVERTKAQLGARGKGRKVFKAEDAFHLREPTASYISHFGPKNTDIRAENTHFWNT
jgi:putative transposase